MRRIDPATLLTSDSLSLFVAVVDSVRQAVVAKKTNVNKVVVAAAIGLAGGGSAIKISVIGTGASSPYALLHHSVFFDSVAA